MNATAQIDTLTFPEFMTEICKNWLNDGWKGYIEESILNSAQGDKPFWDWLQLILSTNALIVSKMGFLWLHDISSLLLEGQDLIEALFKQYVLK